MIIKTVCTKLFFSLVVRVGRNGCTSLSLLYTNKSEQKACKDSALFDVVAERGTMCRRKALLNHSGSDEMFSFSWNTCCDVCGQLSVSTFKFLTPIKATCKARPRPLRNVSPQLLSLLKARLLRERGRLLRINTSYKALGGTVVCPVASINKVCNRIKYIKDLQDVCAVSCIPCTFAESFF